MNEAAQAAGRAALIRAGGNGDDHGAVDEVAREHEMTATNGEYFDKVLNQLDMREGKTFVLTTHSVQLLERNGPTQSSTHIPLDKVTSAKYSSKVEHNPVKQSFTYYSNAVFFILCFLGVLAGSLQSVLERH